MTTNPARPGRIAFLSLACSLLACGIAWPQDKDAPAHRERIEVTGTNIPRADAEGALPLQVITRQGEG